MKGPLQACFLDIFVKTRLAKKSRNSIFLKNSIAKVQKLDFWNEFAKSFLCLWIRASFGLITLLVPMEGYLHYGCYTLASHGFVPIVRHVIVTTKEPRSICTYHSAGVFSYLLLSSCVFVPTDK